MPNSNFKMNSEIPAFSQASDPPLSPFKTRQPCPGTQHITKKNATCYYKPVPHCKLLAVKSLSAPASGFPN